MRTVPVLATMLWATACASSQPPSMTASEVTAVSTVVLAAEVSWDQLNPARGDQSPKAATLWGDRKGSRATGFLFNPVDGFRSPPHIHNVSYRGLVIRGLVHNDDPDAAEMWMPAGSFWTQPKGAAHITSARGNDTLAYIEIDSGPYLVHPVEKAFPSDEKPINVDASNIVWVRSAGSSGKSRVAHLWGDPEGEQPTGTLLKLPRGFEGIFHSRGPDFRAVVIRGSPKLQMKGNAQLSSLEPGGYFASSEPSAHRLSCGAGDECVIYIRTAGRFGVAPTKD